MIELSIIIVNWNTREDLLSCLRSIFEERQGASREVIVIDNGSRDGSGRAAKQAFPLIHLIENEKNLGFAKASNQGLQKASGRYLLLLNPDTRVKPGAIEQLVSFMKTCPEAGSAGAQLLNSDGSKQNSIANFPSLATELLNKSLLRRFFPKTFPGKERDYREPMEVDSVIGACMMVRRDVLNRVGYLDEGYFLFLEETDWCYRMEKAGWKIYHVPQAEVYHCQGKSAKAVRDRAKVEFYRSRYRFFKEARGSLQWLVLLTGLVMKLTVESVFAGVVSLLTFFTVRRVRRKLSSNVHLLWWHLRLCPKGMGLEPERD